MIIKRTSAFKSPAQDHQWFENWVTQLERLNNKTYQRIEVNSSLGKTIVWGLNQDSSSNETLVIFPGARTTPLFWDLHNNLSLMEKQMKIFLVETNGLPNLSDGNSPDIKSNEYGDWAAEILEKLKIDKAYIAGASFGGLICMKLCIVRPALVRAAFLLNPGCLQPFSLTFKNLYYNILPLIIPSHKNISLFLDKAVFSKPNHTLSKEYEKLVIDYEHFAITRYNDKTQKPYFMGDDLLHVNTDTYLIEGDKDLLFPYEKSIANAKRLIKNLKDVKVFENVGHGIETFREAIVYLDKIIKHHRDNSANSGAHN
jgi:esterase/lipase